jgi:hypothetical protein
MYDVELSQRLCIIKSSTATSRVNWLNGEKSSVLVLRALQYFSTLRTRTKMVLEMLVFSPFSQLTRLVAREDFIIILIDFVSSISKVKLWNQILMSVHVPSDYHL